MASPFEHRPWSTFGDADKIAPYNPLRRVPTLVLDSGEALIESTAILDYLDELVGPEAAMIAERGRRAAAIADLRAGQRARRQGGQPDLRAGAAQGSAALWVERCEAQIGGVLDMLEKERAAVATPYWFGERIGHADIMVACALRFTSEAHPALFDARYPALTAHAARCEALPPFRRLCSGSIRRRGEAPRLFAVAADRQLALELLIFRGRSPTVAPRCYRAPFGLRPIGCARADG